MSHRKCFEGPSEKIYSGDYISRKKAKTIYKASVNLARQPTPGIYRKKTSIGGIGSNAKKKGSNQAGIYVGDVYIGSGLNTTQTNTNSNACLIGARNYETLLSVTQGKYLSNPVSFDIRRTQSLWIYSVYQMDYSGIGVIINHPQSPVESSSINTFNYPPPNNVNQIHPIDSSNNNIGLVVDYNYNIFYPEDITQSNRGTCYLKNERSWKQYLKCLPYTLKDAYVYFQAQNGYIGDFNYPAKFSFNCNNNLYSDISTCLVTPVQSSQYTFLS